MVLFFYLAGHPWPLTPRDIVRLVGHVLIASLCLLWWWALYRWLIERPVGPSAEFAASLRPRPVTPPPPPNPNLEVWKPWFRLYGPLFLELNNATGRIPTAWQGRAHEHAAYRFYMEDRLPEAKQAAQRALKTGTRPGLWSIKLFSLAAAELDAREHATRMEGAPFIFELPADDRQYDSLIETAERCAERVDSLLGFSACPTVFTLLNEEQLRRDAGSRWGYLAIKRPYRKICLLRAPESDPTGTSAALVHEYVRLAVHELSRERAPRWLTEGLAEWVVREVLSEGSPLAPSSELRQLRPSERALEFAVRRSRLDRMADMGATDYGLVERLVETYGEAAIAQFVRDLAHRSEGAAFKKAFDVSQRQFERRWRRQAQEAA